MGSSKTAQGVDSLNEIEHVKTSDVRQRRRGKSDVCAGSCSTSAFGRAKPNTSSTRSSKDKNRTQRLARRTWTLPLLLILAFLSIYAVNPTESNIAYHFIFLSYKLKEKNKTGGGGGPATPPPQYGKGPWDVAFVVFYTIVLSFTREFVMQELLRPVARLCGIRARGKQSRFMEQMYAAVYTGLSGPLGMYVMRRTPVWYFDTRGMYEAYPHRTHEGVVKFYYLVQAAFWVQQAVVMFLGLEKRRKDFRELVGHHVVTVALIALSYRFHFTYMGIAVYTTHDISDFFLATSKSLNYVNSPLQAPSFGLCIGMWIYLRHYINLRILYSLLGEYSVVGPYGMDWETEQYKGLFSNVVTFGLLAALQILNLFWLYCLLRSAYRFVVKGIAKDDRSEGEEEGEEGDDGGDDVQVVEQDELGRTGCRVRGPEEVDDGDGEEGATSSMVKR